MTDAAQRVAWATGPVLHHRSEGDGAAVFELTVPASRAVVVESLIRARARCTLAVAGHSASAALIAAHDLGLLFLLDSEVAAGPCAVRCELYDVPFLLSGWLLPRNPVHDPSGCDDGEPVRHAVFSDVRVYTLDDRRGKRIALGTGQIELRWARVVDGALQVAQSDLLDIAPGGASIELSRSDPLPPNDAFVAELRSNEVKIPLLARRRRCEHRRENARIGLHLDMGRDRRKLVELYMRQRFPSLVPRYAVEADKLGKLLEDSGYLNLREGDGCTPSWHRYRSPHSLDFVYRARDNSLLGHLSSTRSYQRTWLMHQLATVSGHSESGSCRSALYDLVSCAPSLFDGEQACALAYFNRKLRWHQLFFGKFEEWVNDPALATIALFDRFEAVSNTGAVSQATHSASLRVEPLREEHVFAAVALIRSQLAPLVADALDINPQDLQTPSLNGDPLRTRSAFALCREQQLLAVALCETGARSASLFDIFNLAQFYFSAGDTRPSVEGQLMLLSAVRAFYAPRETPRPLILAPTGTFAAAREAGTRLAESMGCFVIGGAGLRQWEHYCRLQMGRLYQRKSPNLQTRGARHVS